MHFLVEEIQDRVTLVQEELIYKFRYQLHLKRQRLGLIKRLILTEQSLVINVRALEANLGLNLSLVLIVQGLVKLNDLNRVCLVNLFKLQRVKDAKVKE